MIHAVTTPAARARTAFRRIDHAAGVARDWAGDRAIDFFCRLFRVNGDELWVMAMGAMLLVLLLVPVGLVAILAFALGRASH